MHMSINMEDMPIEIVEMNPVNPLISKCQIKICYVGDTPNRNRSIITKDTAKKIAPSIPGCPIVGFYNEATGDFEEHNRTIDISNGQFKVKDTTRPYGFVPTDAKVWFQWFEDDGVPHEYMMTEGYIWTGQYPESQRIIDEGNNQSMELDDKLIDAYWTKDTNGKPQFFIINEAIMSKLCILGEEVEPCFEGASITKVQFAFEDEFKVKLYNLMEKMQEILSKEGGTPVFNTYAVEIGGRLWDAIYDYMWEHRPAGSGDLTYMIEGIYEEGTQKFAILQDRKDLTYYRLDFSLTETDGFKPADSLVKVSLDFKPAGSPAQFAFEDVKAYEAKFMENKVEKPEDNAVVEQPVVEEPAPVVEEIPAAVEESASAVEVTAVVEDPAPAVVKPASNDGESKLVEYNLNDITEYQELLTKYSTLENQMQELQKSLEAITAERDTLASFKNDIDREKKEKLLSETFFMLSDDVKKEYKDNIDKYSYDDIEKELSVFCVRNKVNFNLTEEKEEEQVTTFNIESVEDKFADAPAWMRRAFEIQEEKNL